MEFLDVLKLVTDGGVSIAVIWFAWQAVMSMAAAQRECRESQQRMVEKILDMLGDRLKG